MVSVLKKWAANDVYRPVTFRFRSAYAEEPPATRGWLLGVKVKPSHCPFGTRTCLIPADPSRTVW